MIDQLITAYFDTSVWMGLYYFSVERTDQKAIELAVKTLVESHRTGNIEIVTSLQVEDELRKLLSDPSRLTKAQNALRLIEELRLRKLPRTPADLGKARLDEARLDQKPNFPNFPQS